MDPSGEYSVDDVTLELNGVEISKGEGAAGAFVRLGSDGSHFTSTRGSDGEVTRSKQHDARRPLIITLLRSSPSNTALASEAVERGARLMIRRTSGEVLFQGDAYRDKPSSDRGEERRWELIAVGGGPDEE